ncbi:hypothetical protein FB451DRAFT_1493022 [Mycena latifolia]|nr:hypothetical protein FB451DRAFT_1493022 [Mycena latifolia]
MKSLLLLATLATAQAVAAQITINTPCAFFNLEHTITSKLPLHSVSQASDVSSSLGSPLKLYPDILFECEPYSLSWIGRTLLKLTEVTALSPASALKQIPPLHGQRTLPQLGFGLTQQRAGKGVEFEVTDSAGNSASTIPWLVNPGIAGYYLAPLFFPKVRVQFGVRTPPGRANAEPDVRFKAGNFRTLNLNLVFGPVRFTFEPIFGPDPPSTIVVISTHLGCWYVRRRRGSPVEGPGLDATEKPGFLTTPINTAIAASMSASGSESGVNDPKQRLVLRWDPPAAAPQPEPEPVRSRSLWKGGMDRSSPSPLSLFLSLTFGTSAIGPDICFVGTYDQIIPSYTRTTIYDATSEPRITISIEPIRATPVLHARTANSPIDTLFSFYASTTFLGPIPAVSTSHLHPISRTSDPYFCLPAPNSVLRHRTRRGEILDLANAVGMLGKPDFFFLSLLATDKLGPNA